MIKIYIDTLKEWVDEPDEYDTRDEAEEAAENLRQVYMTPDLVNIVRQDAA